MTNAEKIRRLDDEHIEKFLCDVQKATAKAVLRMVADAIVAYLFDANGKEYVKDFLKKEDKNEA